MEPEEIRVGVALTALWTAFVCGILIIIPYFPRRSIFPANVVFQHFVAIVLGLVCYLLRLVYLYKRDETNPAFCRVQATGVHYFTAVACLMTACHLWNIHSFVVLRRSSEVLEKRFRLYMLLSYGVPLIPAVIVCLFADVELLGLWCWVARLGPYQSAFRLSLYFQLATAGAFGIYFCVKIIMALWRHTGQAMHNTVRGGTVIRLSTLGFGFAVSVMLASLVRFLQVADPAPSDDQSEYGVGSSELAASIVSFLWGIVFLTSPTVLGFYSECGTSSQRSEEKWRRLQAQNNKDRRSKMYKSSSADKYGSMESVNTTDAGHVADDGSVLDRETASDGHNHPSQEHDPDQPVVSITEDESVSGRERDDTEYDLIEKYELALNRAFEPRHNRSRSTGEVLRPALPAPSHKRGGSHDQTLARDPAARKHQRSHSEERRSDRDMMNSRSEVALLQEPVTLRDAVEVRVQVQGDDVDGAVDDEEEAPRAQRGASVFDD